MIVAVSYIPGCNGKPESTVSGSDNICRVAGLLPSGLCRRGCGSGSSRSTADVVDDGWLRGSKAPPLYT